MLDFAKYFNMTNALAYRSNGGTESLIVLVGGQIEKRCKTCSKKFSNHSLKRCFFLKKTSRGSHDYQHNDIQHNDSTPSKRCLFTTISIQDSQHNGHLAYNVLPLC